ncbi:MAG: hypothetical protein Q8Q51_05010 [Lutibacter sp.]|nr:hypothetical protein [Lutibacter sp.]
MINTVQRLEFENVYPEEKKKEILEYLNKVSSFTLLNIIGFSNTTPQPNFDNITSNSEIQNDIIERVIKYSRENSIKEKPELVSREASLKLAEIILANKDFLIENNKNSDRDLDELNLFKSFLIINKEVNSKQKLISSDDNFDKMVDMMIAMSFPTSDLGIFENNDFEFGKLIYSTIVRFELLLEFLQSKVEYAYLVNNLYEYFNLENLGELNVQMKYLFGKLLELKQKNGFKFRVEDEKALLFLNTLVSNEIIEDDDFTNLKNHPLYKIDENTFSIIDFFFVVDKFTKSVKFILKSAFHKHHNLPAKDRTFFSFFNTKFSEEYLMQRILDKFYFKKYFIKKEIKETQENEPDYYIRHNNKIYLFENKDVLIAKDIKSSGNIDKINKVLKSKFLETDNKPIGIGQLVTSIAQIVENNFHYDDYVNSKNNFTIYPILLVSDRIFEILGVNYRLNQWYLDLVKVKLGNKYDPRQIKNLTVIDIDTLIFWLPYLEKSDNNFRIIIDDHLKRMTTKKKINHRNPEEVLRIVNKNLTEQLSPISTRFNEYRFPKDLLIDKFREVTTKE